jgi:pimeloyl-ACP methyl ester carboxylesterase
MSETRTAVAPDGREVCYAVWGDRAGFPIMSLHGTPGCRLNRWPDEEVYRGLDVCLVTHDRAGYGRSTRRRGRSVAAEADDVALIADELGFDRFAVTGGSGGGPHALACAALLPDRVVRAVCVVGVAPLGTPGLERDVWLEGQDPENVKEFEWAEAGEDVLTDELERLQATILERVAADPSTVLGDFELSESDRAQLTRPEVMEVIRAATAEQAVNGVWGWVGDPRAGARPLRDDRRARASGTRRMAGSERAGVRRQDRRRRWSPRLRPGPRDRRAGALAARRRAAFLRRATRKTERAGRGRDA